jgi:putative ATP-binding cassette transporter
MALPTTEASRETRHASSEPAFKRSPAAIVREFMLLSAGFWRGPKASTAWLLSLASISFVLVALAFQIAITLWNRFFFNALESKDGAGVLLGLQLIIALTIAAVASGFTFNQINLRLRLRWREWLTLHLLSEWLVQRRFYQLSISSDAPSNPEYRIAEDLRIATETPADIVYGLSSSLLSGLTFIGVLWLVGGSIDVPLGGATLTIPAYMVIGVLAYSLLSTTIMAIVGRPLIARIETKNAAEAEFRYEVTRVRENSEDIALIGGDRAERRRLAGTFADLAERWIEMINRVSRMTGLTYGNATIAPVIPLLLASPKYLAGQLSLGEVMQLAAAFLIVHQALNWLADNSVRIAEWLASAERVVELAAALDKAREPDTAHTGGRIAFGSSGDDTIRVVGLAIADPSGASLVEGPEITIRRGEHVLVQGASGSGKSTLVRTLAGLWPWGRGSILLPSGARVSFVLQRPYMPVGTLQEALGYPLGCAGITEETLVRALERCDLGHLARRLADTEDWSKILSGGEQQRLAFARLLVHPPSIVVLDEATSALDDAAEARMMTIFHDELPAVTVIGVGRRPQHEQFYDRKISLLGVSGRPMRAEHGPAAAPRAAATGHKANAGP